MERDREVDALRRLLQATTDHPAGTPHRRKWVAEQASCSADNLYQVAKGIRLKSGKPRKLGREVVERLDGAFPGWLDAQGCAARPIPRAPELPEALPVVLDGLLKLPPARWASVRAQLDQLALHPEMRDDVLAELQALLTPPAAGKRQVGT